MVVLLFSGCTTIFTETVTQSQTQNPVMTFSSRLDRSTPIFTVEKSPWILEYSTQYDGHLKIQMQPFNKLILVNEDLVTCGVYKMEMQDYTGYTIWFDVTAIIYTGDLTISIIEK